MENQFAAIDISFIGTQGSYNYSKFFIEFIVNEICPFNCVFLCINSNSNSYAKMLSNKFGFKTVVFDSIFSYLSHLYFLRKSIYISVNNILHPSIAKRRILLLHNCYYTMTVRELIFAIANKYVPLSFSFKYIYFHTIIKLFPPTEIYIQSNSQSLELEACGIKNTIVIPPSLYIEYTKKILYTNNIGKSVKTIDLLILSGHQCHKQPTFELNVINTFIDATPSLTSALVVGSLNHDYCPNIDMSLFSFISSCDHLELLKLISRSKLVIIPSKYDSLGLPILECIALGTPFIAYKNKSSIQLASSSQLYTNSSDFSILLNEFIYF